MKLNQCPACQSRKIKFSFNTKEKDYSKYGYRYFKCLSCKGYFLNPIPSKDQIALFYNNGKLNKVSLMTSYDLKKKWLSKDRFRRDHKQYIKPLLRYKKTGKHLDIGCGEGWFIHHTSLNGFQSIGIDFDKDRIQNGKKIFKGKLIHGNLKKLEKLRNNSFDVISLLSILEHVQQPSDLLIHINKLIKKNGIVMIVIPTVDSLQFKMLRENYYWFMAPYHINLFSLLGLRKLLLRTGFSIISKMEIDKNWYWTKAIVDKLQLNHTYQNWRKDPKFVKFDMEIDKILDKIAKEYSMSSAILVFARKN